MAKTKIYLSDISLYFIAAVFSLFIANYFLFAHGFQWDVPREYESDALFQGAIIKTLIDTGWYLTNPFLGAPGSYSLVDYPFSDNATYGIIKIFSWVSDNYAVLMNVFYMMTFVLTSLVSLFVYQRLGLNKAFSFTASLLFAFVPYHIMCGVAHLALSTIYVIPLYVLLMSLIFKNHFLYDHYSHKNFYQFYLQCLGCFAICFFAASSGVYYAAFAILLLGICGVLASLEKKQWDPCINATILVVFIVITVLINTWPTLIAFVTQGENTAVLHRRPGEAEFFGLKLVQMLLPIDYHRILSFSQIKDYYNYHAPLINENTTASLGVIGSIGFILSLFILMVRNVLLSTKQMIFDLSRLNLIAFLIGTVGGVGSMVALFVSPLIRCYNRISVFIAFFSFAIFFLVLEAGLKYFYNSNISKKTQWMLALSLLVIGLYDQMGSDFVVLNATHTVKSDYNSRKNEFMSDSKFIQSIEKKMPAQSLIFQLPYASFPEAPIVYHMGYYQLFRAYIHSHTLHWSYGAINGSPTSKWQESVAHKPTQDMLNELIKAGFTGLYINRNGYPDQAKKIEKEITNILHVKPMINDANDLLFYDLNR